MCVKSLTMITRSYSWFVHNKFQDFCEFSDKIKEIEWKDESISCVVGPSDHVVLPVQTFSLNVWEQEMIFTYFHTFILCLISTNYKTYITMVSCYKYNQLCHGVIF